MSTALLLIDLQNDFLSPSGFLSTRNYLATTPDLQSNISAAISHFRAQKCPIFWVRSQYPSTQQAPSWPRRPVGLRFSKAPMNDKHLASSHRGKRSICAAGSKGAEIYPGFEKLREEGDTVITKTYYSAFTKTDLADQLKKRGVATLVIAGVSANHCILATATDGFFNEFEIYVLSHCVGAISESVHQMAMASIAEHYGRIESNLTKIPTTPSEIFARGDESNRVLYYVNGSIPSWRVMMILSELGLDYTPIRLKVMSRPKETRSAAFSRINPRCKTPTLVDCGRIVIESMAILQYLEQKYGQTGNKDSEKWVTTLVRFHESENAHYVFEDIELCFEDTLSPAQCDRVVEAVDRTLAEMAHWEMYLSMADYVAGEKFTIADCAFYPCIAYLEHRGWDFDDFPALGKYADRIRQRKCAIDACPMGWDKKGRPNLWKKAIKLKNAKNRPDTDYVMNVHT